MKVKLYESQLNRTDDTGSRTLTAQVNTNLFAQLGGAATNIGKAITNLGVQKLKYDEANEKLDNRNKATLAVTAFKDEVDTKLRKIRTTADPTTAYDTAPKVIAETFNKYKNAYSDNKKIQQLFMLDASIIAIDKKNKFLDEFLEKKIQLGEVNVAQRVTNHLDIAVDSGNELNNRLNAATNAEEELKIAKDNFVLSDIKYKEEVSKFNYNMVENTIASLMYGSNSPDLIAQAIEDEDFLQGQGDAQDLILSKYYAKLTSDQKIKVQEYANKKADSIMKADEDRVKRDEAEIDKKHNELKRQFTNSNDKTEQFRIHELLLKTNGYNTLSQRDNFEKQLEGLSSTVFRDEDDDDAYEKYIIARNNGSVSQDDLITSPDFKGKFTKETYETLRKELNTELKESEKNILKEIAVVTKTADRFIKSYHQDTLKIVNKAASPYIIKFFRFIETNPSKKELRDEADRLIKDFKGEQKIIYSETLADELIGIAKQYANLELVKLAIKNDNFNLTNFDDVNVAKEKLNQLVLIYENRNDIDEKKLTAFRNKIRNDLDFINDFGKLAK